MREQKLCPFINNGVPCVDQDLASGMWQCVEAKCAMWRLQTAVKNYERTADGTTYDNVMVGYCGLVGNP